MSSRLAPCGRSRTTWISDLLSNGKQLHPHVLGDEQRAGGDGRRADDEKEDLRPPSPFQERAGDGDIEAAHRADAVMAAAIGRPGLAPGETQQEPGRHRHRDEEREQHRDRGVRRDRAHVGAHHAAHEHHRQKRGDDGQRRDDGRIADLGDRLDRGLGRFASLPASPNGARCSRPRRSRRRPGCRSRR